MSLIGTKLRGFVCRSTNNPLGLAAVIAVTLAASALLVEPRTSSSSWQSVALGPAACTCPPSTPHAP